VVGNGHKHEECGDIARKATRNTNYLPTQNVQHFSRTLMSSAPNTIPTPTTSDPHFDSALAEYSMHTGYDLLSHPRTTAIDQCGSLGSVLDMFREQSRAFDEFRHRDPELVKWLEPIVTKLHVIRTSAALRAAGATLVSPTQLHLLSPTYFNASF